MLGDCARLQLREEEFALLTEKRQEILDGLKKEYAGVLLDLEVRR